MIMNSFELPNDIDFGEIKHLFDQERIRRTLQRRLCVLLSEEEFNYVIGRINKTLASFNSHISEDTPYAYINGVCVVRQSWKDEDMI